jgi:hypothetical protein
MVEYSWILPVAEQLYANREDIQTNFQKVSNWLLGEKSTIVITGLPGVGKTVLSDSLQLFSIINIVVSPPIVVAILQHVKREDYFVAANYSSPKFIALFVVVGIFLFSGLFSVFSEMYLRKIRRRIKSDLRALGSIVDLLRENFLPLTSHLSELQKIQLKIHISRFDVEMESSIPTRLYLKMMRFPFRILQKL